MMGTAASVRAGRETLISVLALLMVGAGWGITMPLTKIAVSSGYPHFGLIFWQLAIGVVVMSVLGLMTGRHLPFNAKVLRVYVTLAVIGTVLPNSISYQAAVHLPSGVLSILLSMIPIWAFPIALLLSLDRFEWRRFAGLGAGFAAVLMIVLPGAEMSGVIPAFWVFAALTVGLFYAFEGNYVAKWGTAGLDPLQVLWGASLVGLCIVTPIVALSGQWISPLRPFTIVEFAHVGSSVTHVLVYAGYVWLVGRTGPVFAVQVSYLVTIFGVFWAKLILSEAYPPAVWLALGMVMLGMYMVRPRSTPATTPHDASG